MHGADVTQTISLYFLNSNAEKMFQTTVLDLLSIFIASLGHDIGHPGLTNTFHINDSTEMAINYNDISCDRCPYSDICYRKEKDYSNS